MLEKRSHGLLTAAPVFVVLSEGLSAQLLSKLLSPLQPVVTAVTNVACSLPLLSSSPKLDGAVQHWVQTGGAGRLRVIVSAEPGLLATVKNAILGASGILLGDLPVINAAIVDIDLTGLSLLTCSTSVSSVSIDAVVGVTGDMSADAGYSLRAALGLPLGTPAGAGVGVAVVDSGIRCTRPPGSRRIICG